MVKTLEMVFHNAAGKEIVLSVAEPKDNLTLAQVRVVMQDIVDKNIFSSKGGDLADIVDARIRTRDAVSLV